MRLSRSAVWGAVGIGLVAEAAVVGASFGFERLTLRANRDRVTSAHGPAQRWREYRIRPVVRPTVVGPDAAGLPDDAEVIGVEVGGKARAYRLDALRDRFRHVVNDQVGTVPVSVAFCDRTDCVRVYTDPGASAPLDVEVAGLYDGEMVVRLGGTLFLHRTGARLPAPSGAGPAPGRAGLPYEALSPERTTWRRWKEKHPATDVYVGDGATGPG